MRSRASLVLIAVVIVACNGKHRERLMFDAGTHHDSNIPGDAPEALAPDGSVTTGDGIAEAKAAPDGSATLEIKGVTVTYVKPPLGSATHDPAGFTIQATKLGPALFVAIDPSTLTPALAKGDVVNFTITAMTTTTGQRRATAISNITRTTQHADVGAFETNVSTATDLVGALDSYDSKLLDISGVLSSDVVASGDTWSAFTLDTGAIAGNAALQLRVPNDLVALLAMTYRCHVFAVGVPMGRFDATAQIQIFDPDELSVSCKPLVRKAVATSATTLAVTFSRTIDSASIAPDGSQFTIAGLAVSAAAVDSTTGTIVDVTTAAQTAQTGYTVSAGAGIKDVQADIAVTASTAPFAGYVAPATVRINELNANITGGCDLVELRVTGSGQLGGFELAERDARIYTFPANFVVVKNDVVLVHFNSASAVCNANAATIETTIDGQPAVAYAGNVDTAFDVWITDTGLASTDNVITLIENTGAIADVVFLAGATATGSAGTLRAASAAGMQLRWSPGQPTYSVAQFFAAAVTNLAATDTVMSGSSIQRVTDLDTASKIDWSSGAGIPSSWGRKNAGQADL